jgi:predicted RecB family nuclease
VVTRYDVSAVTPQGGYVAKQCPVRAQWDVIRPCEPRATPPDLERRFARGRAFEAQVFADLAALHPAAVVLAGLDHDLRAERESATLGAMTAGAGLIIAGRLPADPAGRRVGEPDVLVAAGGGYRPVDIKHHRTLRPGPAGTSDLAALCSPLSHPGWEYAAPDPDAAARKRRDDLLQLAHYQRMLEAAGLAAAAGRYGGIIGIDAVVTWYDLDAPIWLTPSVTGQRKLRSTMAVYDFEFEFRLDIIAVAAMHQAGQHVTPLVVPVRISECPACPWWSWCGPQLAAGSGDVSLLPRIGWRAWRVHRDHGVTDRASLASLDYLTATLVASGVDLRPLLAALDELPADTPVAAVIGERKHAQAAQLAAAGITTLGDARVLSAPTASYCDQPLHDLAQQIDQARAAVGQAPAYRRRGVAAISVPRGDIEVDIDMENTEDGVYLWGALVTSRSANGLSIDAQYAGYHPFSCWEPMTPGKETDLFTRFWQWLSGVRSAVAEAGLQLRAYCYNATAENSQMSRIAVAAGLSGEVAAFLGSEQWIDLLRVFDSQVITGSSAGLKSAAALAGFAWDVQDPGGGESQVRHDAAVGTGAPAQAAREWLLAYNRSDTQATQALRTWLDGQARDCPPIEDVRSGSGIEVEGSVRRE